MIFSIPLTTTADTQLLDISEPVLEIVRNSGVEEGLCVIYSPHSTAGITLNTTHDPLAGQDILDEFDRLVPIRATFKHTLDTPADAAGHIKLVLVGNSASLPVQRGELSIGNLSVLFFEFDGPRDREVQVQILRDC